MQTYHKISTPFKRHKDGPQKGKLIMDDWAKPEFKYLAGNQWSFTEKMDGTNIRVHLHLNQDHLTCTFAGRSDNALIPEGLLNYLKDTFKDSPKGSPESAHIGRWMLDNELSDAILYGEGIGPKIQGGGKYTSTPKFVLFDVGIGNVFLRRDAVDEIADTLRIESVPTLGKGTLQDAIDIVSTGITFNSGGGVIRWGRGGLRSQYGDFEAEGIIAEPVVPMYDRLGNRIITKVKGKDFK